ncbi:L,D-transpeptidase [Devosia sp.]|uniref:L,D-transpeptidase n=1 Tax=Devosia sp. TaxID=1871048 RepID=UPI0032669941
MVRVLFVALALMFGAVPAFARTVSIVVDISDQSMAVSVDGDVQYRWDVSTGKRGYHTPTGNYEPIRMARRYYSKKYDNAPMPYSIFFHGGYAIHGTTHLRALGTPASHGCVRLDPENAAVLYELVREYGPDNTAIQIRS